jgi:hypothetical protein
VDTEGYDYFVLKSLEKIIKEFRPTIICEFLKKMNLEERQRQLRFLNFMGYEVFLLTSEDHKKSTLINEQNLLDVPHFDTICFSKNQ